MAEPMDERMPPVTNQLPGHGIQVDRAGPDDCGRTTAFLHVPDRGVQLELPLGGRPADQGAGHVRVVAGHPRPEVELDQVPSLQHPVGRLMVGDGGMRAEGDDAVERSPLGARRPHGVHQEPRDLAFSAPRAQLAEDGREGTVGDLTSGPQRP